MMLGNINRIFGKNSEPGRGKKILVVEDNEVDRRVIQDALEKSGYEVLLAENGAVGLRMAEEENPDLILLDCTMPVMSGQEMCRRVKRNERTKNIPVVFLTGLTDPKNIIDCFELEAENYLSKPVNPKLLSSQIEMIFNECHPNYQ